MEQDSSRATQQYDIRSATNNEDVRDVGELSRAYVESLGIDLTFQDFQTELSAIPGKYAPPSGALLLARDTAGTAVGCIGLRPLRDGSCEIKRLYASTAGRGKGMGKVLATAAIDEARRLGYQALRLDTLPSMDAARSLYKRLGFEEIEAYYETPLMGTIFMELDLQATQKSPVLCMTQV